MPGVLSYGERGGSRYWPERHLRLLRFPSVRDASASVEDGADPGVECSTSKWIRDTFPKTVGMLRRYGMQGECRASGISTGSCSPLRSFVFSETAFQPAARRHAHIQRADRQVLRASHQTGRIPDSRFSAVNGKRIREGVDALFARVGLTIGPAAAGLAFPGRRPVILGCGIAFRLSVT